jgi:hypothetical protein
MSKNRYSITLTEDEVTEIRYTPVISTLACHFSKEVKKVLQLEIDISKNVEDEDFTEYVVINRITRDENRFYMLADAVAKYNKIGG